MKKVALSLVAGLLAAPLLTAPVAPALAKPSAEKIQAQKDAQLTQVVIDYVRGARGWMDGSYKVSLEKKDGDLLIYYVNYIDGDTASNLVTGEGVSFRVAVNPVTKKVERELY